MKKNIISKLLTVLLTLVLFVSLVSCDEIASIKDPTTNTSDNPQVEEPSGNDPVIDVKYECTVTQYDILKNTPNQTTVYEFKSNGNGPRVAIIGGTHGDEVAGWKAALRLINKMDWAGDVLLIPQCNILADNREERYPGLGKTAVNGEIYSDLNRSYPGYTTTPKAATLRIMNAIIEVINEFGPDHLIDLHESVMTATDPNAVPGRGVGDLLIFGNTNSALSASEIVYDFNQKWNFKDSEHTFGTDSSAPLGSFNHFFGELYPDGLVLTIETVRSNALERRIEQQLMLIDIILDYIYKDKL